MVNTRYVTAEIRSVSLCSYSIKVLLIDRTIFSVSTARGQVRPKVRKILEVVIPFRRGRLAYHATSGGSGTSFRAEEEDQAILEGRDEDAEEDQEYDGDVDVERSGDDGDEIVSSRPNSKFRRD
jgi:hypothetical protein